MSEGAGHKPAVSLIVVNYNGADFVQRCIDSLLLGFRSPVEIVVIDNASTDGSVELLRRLSVEEPGFELVESDRNLGYAGAINAVLPACKGHYIGVLNMDLVAESDWLGPLVEYLDAHPDVAAVNPLITLDDGETVNAIGLDLHVSGLAFNHGLGQERADVSMAPVSVDGLQGAAFLIRKQRLEEIGGLDASGFLYHEDVRLSWALRSMGHELACVPRSVVRHDYFLSMHPEKFFLLERNRIALLLCALNGSSLVLIGPVLFVSELMSWGYALLRGHRYLGAKARSYAAIANGRAEIRAQKVVWKARQQVSDLALLGRFRWRYAWDQFATLATQRGAPRRPFESS